MLCARILTEINSNISVLRNTYSPEIRYYGHCEAKSNPENTIAEKQRYIFSLRRGMCSRICYYW